MEVTILSTGLQTSYQDGGRPGYEAFGVPVGGALDARSAMLANQLVGHAPGAPLLEITVQGPRLYFSAPAQVALTGADCPLLLNGVRMPAWHTVDVPAEGVLYIGRARQGCRAYLAIRGHWEVPRWLGSVSRLPGAEGLLPAVERGSTIRITPMPRMAPRAIPVYLQPRFHSPAALRLLPGPEHGIWAEAVLRPFWASSHRVSKMAGRMGCRLESSLPWPAGVEELISSPVLPGTLQVTRSGQPILLLADAQTTGGYPRLGQLHEADIPLAAQLGPGATFTFHPEGWPSQK